MTHQHHTLRPAMTAIAAVIALSSTPSFAQVAETPAPIIETSPAPAPTPTSPDPLAPDSGTPTVTPDPVASETTAAPAATARPAAKASRPAARATTTRTASVTRTRAAAPVTVDAAPPTAPAPVDPLLVPPEMAAPAPIAAPAEAAPVAIDQVTIEEALPYAGAAGLALLALAGTGIVVGRRRRRREDAIEEAKWQHIVAAPESALEPDPAPAPAVIEPAPTFVRTPHADPVPVAAPVAATGASTLPDGFDVSRFGPHVQAAYAGQTPDNPSASLKRRLTVGHFLDQKEAAAAEAAPAETAPAQTSPPTSPGMAAAKPAWAARADSDFMFRRDDKQPTPRPTPAYQK